MAELAIYGGGWIVLLAFMGYRQCRHLAPSLLEQPAPPQELLARHQATGWGFDDIYPEREAS